MAEDLYCPICMVRFNESARKPLFLACGHTFCQECLLSIQSRGKLRCPNCNKEDQRLVGHLPMNLVVQELLIKGLLQGQQGTADPWTCQLHPGEPQMYFSSRRRAFLCEECVRAVDPSGPVVRLDKEHQNSLLKKFEKLYTESTIEDLERRDAFLALMERCVIGEQARFDLAAQDTYDDALNTLACAYKQGAARVGCYYDAQTRKLDAAAEAIGSVRLRRQMRLSLRQESLRADLLPALDESETLRSSEATGSLVLPALASSDLCTLLASTVHRAFQESGGRGNPVEHRVSRFKGTSQRWGVFSHGRQVEAITFQTSRPIFLTAVAVANALFPREPMKCLYVEVVDGRRTDGQSLERLENISLSNWEKVATSVKVVFLRPIPLRAFHDYTLKAQFQGAAGLYRGLEARRTVAGNKGVDFVFTQAEFAPGEVENGKNVSDGPLLDLFYTFGDDSGLQVPDLQLAERTERGWTGTVKISVSEAAQLVGIALSGPVDSSKPAVLEKLALKLGPKDLVSVEKPLIVTLADGQLDFPLTFAREVILLPGKTYDLSLKVNSRSELRLKSSLFAVDRPPLASFSTVSPSGEPLSTSAISYLRFASRLSPHNKYCNTYAAIGDVPAQCAQSGGGYMVVPLFRSVEPALARRNGPNALKFQVSHSVVLARVQVAAGTAGEVEGVQVFRDRELVLVQDRTQCERCVDNHRLWEVQLRRPVRCEPGAVYSLLVMRTAADSAEYLGVEALDRTFGPEGAEVIILSADGTIVSLGVATVRNEHASEEVKGAMCEMWEGGQPARSVPSASCGRN